MLDPTGREHLLVSEGAPPSLGGAAEHVAADALPARLAAARVGVRLYVHGSEGFVRRVCRLAEAHGVVAGEIATELAGSRRRRVLCLHCKTATTDVATTLVTCAGCGRRLSVYHHYSRRHGAYMGFQADAEVPGELPASERAWP